MDLGHSRPYEIELWSSLTGVRIADISQLCFNRSFTLVRNDAEQLTFSVDLFEFETYCLTNLGGMDPQVLLNPDVTDVKVKRAGIYLFGTQVVDVSFDLQPDSAPAGSSSSNSQGNTVTITAMGYLNLLKDRYVTKSYLATERTSIATDLITTTQTQTNGSVGITNAGSQYPTGQSSDRTYQLDNVKLKIQELAALSDSPFDFSFSPSKVFQTYSKIGARRTDISLIYGGPLSNVRAFALDRSALNLFNKVYGLGSGFGTDQLTSTQSDSVSQLRFYLREKISQYNSVILQATLDQNTLTDVALSKDILELPVVTITSKEVPINAAGVAQFFSPGDRIPLQVLNHPWLASINGLYRIEQIDVSIDENDFEEIKLTFDTYGVNQSE